MTFNNHFKLMQRTVHKSSGLVFGLTLLPTNPKKVLSLLVLCG